MLEFLFLIKLQASCRLFFSYLFAYPDEGTFLLTHELKLPKQSPGPEIWKEMEVSRTYHVKSYKFYNL